MVFIVLVACSPPGAVGLGQDSGVVPADSAADSAAFDADSGDTASPDSSDTGGADTGSDPPVDDIVVWAVRHAEKEEEGDDPDLTAEGQARAEALVPLMATEPLSAIYATDLQRTQQTCQPTASDHGLPVLEDAEAEDAFAAYIVATHPGETVLHCGHSYTLPDFFAALGLDPVPAVEDYGQLWEIRLQADGSVTYTESRFGDE